MLKVNSIHVGGSGFNSSPKIEARVTVQGASIWMSVGIKSKETL